MSKQAARDRFNSVYKIIHAELVERIKSEGMPADAVEWYSKNLDYNVPGGKLNRGMSVVDTLRILRGSELSQELYTRAAILGWCIELLQAFFLVTDDIMDASITRRGQPCYYRQPSVGMVAVNDAFMLEAAIYQLLKSHFRSEPYYVDLVELFHETTYQTEVGQLIDLITAPEDHVDLTRFSIEKHRLIVVYKTAFYSFYLPVALAMHMAGIKSPAAFATARNILIPLGEYFQVQDDWLDYSAPPEVLGKVGTDIVDNKCSWCVNKALALATPEQRKILDENYGRKDAQCEARVKALYEELKLADVYAEYEKDVTGKIRALVDQIDELKDRLKKDVFLVFLGKIEGRTK
ncbi:farnesyl-diphosphate synthase [Fistulina hepatica ATCC 64428]|uniref:(2E,6E)-farnesyl diphosphate synthase n=1 Tax=Fistulina hepatica ATCC 64428 TaxID=1128425 RepID=A0A0D7A366_9AGAR|nr:farnesyl-diphosphate synthase [Fistulina hepatica ATCC 64428]